jgi:hypothetical protein
MGSNYCGKDAKITYQVDASLIGEFAEIQVRRFDQKSITANGFQELKAAKTDMLWPDQEQNPGHGYYGGRQVDFKGLGKKSYADKFAQQNFTLEIHHGDQTAKSSGTEIIDELPAAGPEDMNVGIPFLIEKWIKQTNPATGAATFSLAPNFPKASTHYAQQSERKHNAGKFTIEHKDGVVIITVKIKLNSVNTNPPHSTAKVFKELKKRVEAFWNSEAQGYNQWIYHRVECARKDKCNCSVVKNQKGEYTASGCCKLPFKVVIVEGGAGDNQVDYYLLNADGRRKARDNMRATKGGVVQLPMSHPNFFGAHFQANTYTLSYPENRAGTYAHEVGHMMGFPDEYSTGAVVSGSMGPAGPIAGAAWPIDDGSVMGASQNKARDRHLKARWFNDWIDSKVDTTKMTVINK